MPYRQSTISKAPYPEPKPEPTPEPTNGNGKGPKARRKELAVSAYFGPTFAQGLDGSTVITSGLATRRYYILARTNPEVRMAIRALTQAVFWAKSHIQTQNDYEKYPSFQTIDDQIVDEVNQQLCAMPNFHRKLQDLFLFGIRCGFAVAEKIWEPIDGTWVLTDLKVRRSWDFEPVVDSTGALESLFYYPTGEYFDPRAFVYAPWPSEGASNWLGEPIIEALIHDVELMQKTEAALAKNAHLLSKRTMIHRFDSMRTDDEIAAAKNAILGIEEGRMPQLPAMLDDSAKLIHHDEIEIMQDRTDTLSMTKLSELAANEAARIKRTVGLPDDLGSTQVSSGSWAKAKVSFDMLLASASDGQDWVSALVNDQIIADIIRFNYPNAPSGYRNPAWIPQEIEEKYSLERAQYWQILIDAGVLGADSPVIPQDLGIPLNQITPNQKPETQTGSGSEEKVGETSKINVPKRSVWSYLFSRQSMIVQSLILAKEVFTREQATRWITDHGYHVRKVDETSTSYRFRQREPGDFKPRSFRTIKIETGVSAVVGKLK